MFVEVPVDRLSILSFEVSMEVPEEEPLSVEVSVEVSWVSLMVGVLEGVPIVLVNRLITVVFCRSENV